MYLLVLLGLLGTFEMNFYGGTKTQFEKGTGTEMCPSIFVWISSPTFCPIFYPIPCPIVSSKFLIDLFRSFVRFFSPIFWSHFLFDFLSYSSNSCLIFCAISCRIFVQFFVWSFVRYYCPISCRIFCPIFRPIFLSGFLKNGVNVCERKAWTEKANLRSQKYPRDTCGPALNTRSRLD